MTKLVWVGPNRGNKSGSSAKGYTVYRRGRVVVTRYGAIEVVGGGGGKYHWLRKPMEERRTFRTDSAARVRVKTLIEQKQNKGYNLLPRQVLLRPPPRRHSQP